MKVNPQTVFRKEIDGSALLFDPESGATFGLNPTRAFLWEQFASGLDEAAALAELRKVCANMPPEADRHIAEFVASLKAKKFIL